MTFAAVVLAAGRGERLGQDKALVDLGGQLAVERVVAACRVAGADEVVVVRRTAAAPLPELAVRVLTVDTAEMIASLRAALGTAALRGRTIAVFPVDYAMVSADTLRAVVGALDGGHDAAIALPIRRGRPGHPIAWTAPVTREVLDPRVADLRVVVRRDPGRVVAVTVEDDWIHRDIDTPADLLAARAALAADEPRQPGFDLEHDRGTPEDGAG